MWKNKFKTVLLLAGLSGLFLLVGGLLGGQTGLSIALVMALLINGITYFFSDKIVLALYGAKALDHDQYPAIVATVEELRETMGLPMPKLWIVTTPVANAFATGRNPQNSSIALTTGIIELLDADELRGVLAHEMSHIYNRDILVSSVAATIATAISYLANMAQHIAFWGAVSGSDRRKNGNPIGMIIIAILTPIAATILQLSISRSREYLADETGAHACKDPLALASALKKLHSNVAHAHFEKDDKVHASTASLCIVHPFLSGNLSELFSTHPPVEKRVERLQHLYENNLTN